MNASLSIIFVFLLVNDIISLVDQLDDELLSYNNYILLNSLLKVLRNNEKVPERLNGLDCKSNDIVFVGSNPILFIYRA